ncbi:hypothetical protein I8751_13650 [Nostocaceae cyanobacterium CENA357]|uniref:Uncharacterized protein n=1 Tax=Atlanticothrix silvestris CENA357 TaxID=1725252 RepID=A0A8J7L0X5_9CYAN|nr:hypothetical protein [Atlanticothrix silvestris]MBH8553400.1 hypothetical protein [Atlanticothrix silvestris CENA357]
MATKPLPHVAFIMGINTTNDAGRTNPDPQYFFYCKLSTARFLDIEAKIFTGTIIRKRKGYTRTKVLADGTTLGGKDAQVAEGRTTGHARAVPHGKNIKLVTGKKTQKGNYQTISFNFPTAVPTYAIGEALGELIPPGKIEATPGNTEIFPYFILPTGSRSGIMKQSAAQTSTNVEVPVTDAARRALIKKKGQDNDLQEGAGT